jgi:hypothetical protein
MPRINAVSLRAQVIEAARTDELTVAAASNTRSAAGNTRISKKEQAALYGAMHEAVDIARSRNPGLAPSVNDVLVVVGEQFDADLATVNQASGSGRAFVSKAEIQALVDRYSPMGDRMQAAYNVLALRAAPPPTNQLDAATVEAQLTAKVGSMYFDGLLGSEGGEEITAVRIPTLLNQPLQARELATALGYDTTTDQGAVERFERPDPDLLNEIVASNGDTQDAKDVVALLRGLTDVRLLIIGKDGGRNVDAVHPTYIVGTAKDGQVVGIKTGVVWT